MSQDPIQMRLKVSRKVLCRLDPRTNGPTLPVLKPLDCRPFIGVAPQVTELLLEHVDGEQLSVQPECFRGRGLGSWKSSVYLDTDSLVTLF